ncbi:hypothetical protein MVEN_02390600 [Mycena venus]|uniref:Uncharacterized protein n=1 Tax=Mycena venus TaxID=2733690 RepID=A0A8H6X262_9AGAR|nr:hypothetical protein MVEN_02390600 [Mycena venus]
MKAEHAKTAQAEAAKARRKDKEAGKRLAKEQKAKKVLQWAREAHDRYEALAVQAASNEREFEEKFAKLQAALDGQTEELRIMEQDLRAARKETVIVQLELAKVKSVSGERELKATEDANMHRARDAELENVCEELEQAHIQKSVRDEELNKTRKKLRLALRDAASARSVAAFTDARHNMAKRDRKVVKQKLKTERAKRRELKKTCRELISIVETLAAAAVRAEKTDRHLHVDGSCKFQKKYMKLKARNSELEMDLAEMDEADTDASRSRKRKQKDTDENER